MKRLAYSLLIVVCAVMFYGCGGNDPDPIAPNPFTLWNSCEALTTLQTYVTDVTNPSSPNFIPQEDRIATFDMDGTFVGELYPTYFEYNMLEYRVLDDADYRDKAPDDVRETAEQIRAFVRDGQKLPDHFDMKHAYAAAKAYSGMTLAEFDRNVKPSPERPQTDFQARPFHKIF